MHKSADTSLLGSEFKAYVDSMKEANFC